MEDMFNMILVFNQREDKEYRVSGARMTEIYNDIDKKLQNIMESYGPHEKDLILAGMCINCISKEINEAIVDKFGLDRIIELSGAVEREDS